MKKVPKVFSLQNFMSCKNNINLGSTKSICESWKTQYVEDSLLSGELTQWQCLQDLNLVAHLSIRFHFVISLIWISHHNHIKLNRFQEIWLIVFMNLVDIISNKFRIEQVKRKPAHMNEVRWHVFGVLFTSWLTFSFNILIKMLKWKFAWFHFSRIMWLGALSSLRNHELVRYMRFINCIVKYYPGSRYSTSKIYNTWVDFYRLHCKSFIYYYFQVYGYSIF